LAKRGILHFKLTILQWEVSWNLQRFFKSVEVNGQIDELMKSPNIPDCNFSVAILAIALGVVGKKGLFPFLSPGSSSYNASSCYVLQEQNLA
jgi:hypothetical protein